MTFQFQAICDQGAVRPNNEDAIKYGVGLDGTLAWMVIADGMGGHNAGEVASSILVDEIEESIEVTLNNSSELENIDWSCWLELTLNRANNKIFAQSVRQPEQQGMGTTAVVAVVYDNQCFMGWVGDSRGYFFRQDKSGSLQQLTQDHTMIQALLDKGAITKKEALESNNKNMLSKAIGIRKGVEVETLVRSVDRDDIILLSTDGLHDSLEHIVFERSVAKILAGTDITEMMLGQAIENGSKDNITFGSILIVGN